MYRPNVLNFVLDGCVVYPTDREEFVMSVHFETPKIPTEPTAQVWQRAKIRLRTVLGEDVFSSWFGRLEFSSVQDNVAHLSVPTRFLKRWLETHYTGHILSTIREEMPEIKEIRMVMKSSCNDQPRPADQMNRRSTDMVPTIPEMPSLTTHERSDHNPRRVSDEPLSGSPLDCRLTFNTFNEGSSNKSAYAAVRRIVETKGGQGSVFSPLYVHGGHGRGKTHLLQALTHEAVSRGRHAVYLTAEKFMYGFVAAVKEGLLHVDLFVLDDVQFLRGKSIQGELIHLLDALGDAKKQIVMSADRPPHDLEELDERIRSRLSGGLCINIDPPEELLRLKILERCVATAQVMHPLFEVTPTVLAFVARTVCSNGRALGGAINRLRAHSMLTGTTTNIEVAEGLIRDLRSIQEPKQIIITDIQKLVASHYRINLDDILSSRRTKTVVNPRQIAMYLAKVLTPKSLQEIGRRFGGRDHATVLHAVRKIERLAKSDQRIKGDLKFLTRMLRH